MEIKILVQLNERAELKKFVETCEEHGMELTREGGGKLPSFSGYYAELKGVRWQKADTGEGQSNIPDVSVSLLERAYGLVGHPCTNISAGTDLACEQWRSDYERWRNER